MTIQVPEECVILINSSSSVLPDSSINVPPWRVCHIELLLLPENGTMGFGKVKVSCVLNLGMLIASCKDAICNTIGVSSTFSPVICGGNPLPWLARESIECAKCGEPTISTITLTLGLNDF